ncbi:MAG: type II toxin-antitoxin system prevent-host-death family antitoxin [Candidatus Eremiobacteraeota bacterium]|nr:type II toxin-antitoxin system prevent-host-death family antitoxin [Candidatus Eremiobacteraeota bacterium]
MKQVGIREVRQNLSALLEVVKRGREIVVTDRGRPVARLVPAGQARAKAFPDLSSFRARMPRLIPPLSETLGEDRSDRL